MIDDIKPSSQPSKSLQARLDSLEINKQPNTEKPEQVPYNKEATNITVNPSQNKVDFEIDEISSEELTPSSDVDQNQNNKKSLKKWLIHHWPPSKKEWAIIVILILLIGGGVVYALTRPAPVKPVAIIKPVIKVAPKPTLVASTLSGLMVAPSVNKQAVTGVMIENSDQARPQAGLSQAGVVFEAIAEGGITRFLALYQDTAPSNVGPIRSARPYYLQWLLGFDGSLAHVGGSPDALSDIQVWGVKDLNEFYNANSYHRISTRQAPHNVYTSIAALNQLETSKGYTSTNFTGFPRKAESPSKSPTTKSININISWADYAVHYDYDSATNSYNRSEAGAPMVDSNSGAQLSPKVVVAIVVPLTRGALDGTGAYYSDYNVIGSGTAYIFQDGNETTGQWAKTSAGSQIAFTDSSGNVIKLNPGQTWLTAVASSGLVSYSP